MNTGDVSKLVQEADLKFAGVSLVGSTPTVATTFSARGTNMLRLVEFSGAGDTPGQVAINPDFVAAVYTGVDGLTAIVLSNGIGYKVQGTREEVISRIMVA